MILTGSPRRNSLELIELSSINIVSLKFRFPLVVTLDQQRDYPPRRNSLELLELSGINIVYNKNKCMPLTLIHCVHRDIFSHMHQTQVNLENAIFCQEHRSVTTHTYGGCNVSIYYS